MMLMNEVDPGLASELDDVLHRLSHVKSFSLLAEFCIRPEMPHCHLSLAETVLSCL